MRKSKSLFYYNSLFIALKKYFKLLKKENDYEILSS